MLLRAVPLLLLLISAANAQTTDPATAAKDSKNDKPKAKKVWTNEDIGTLQGGVSVVGNSTTPTQPGEKAKGETAKPSGIDSVPMKECESDVWIRALSAIAASQGYKVNPRILSDKLFGGGCESSVRLEIVGRRVGGDYTLDDGTRIQVKPDYVPKGFPSSSTMVNALRDEKPFLVVWKGRPLLATSVDYIDTRSEGITAYYTIRKLYMTDPGSGQAVIYDTAVNSETEIDGALLLAVTPRK